MRKLFMKNVIPSMIAFFFSGIYVCVDGLFVGRALGDAGIAAINLAWPIAAIILASGIGIGMGGSIVMSNYLGAGKKEKADRVLGNTLLLLVIFSIFISIFILVFAKSLLIIMGASGAILDLGYNYIRVLGMGAIIQVMGTGMAPLLRNQNKAWIAMAFMISNFVIDTILSGVFVMILNWGVTGAAGASLVGEAVALGMSLTIMFKKENRVSLRNYVPDFSLIKSILKVGISPFGLSFIPSLTIVIINWQALAYGRTTAVAAYAVVSYLISTGQLLLQGIGDGIQPLISFHYGAGDKKLVQTLKRWTYELSFVTGIVIFILIVLLTDQIPNYFGVSDETGALLHTALPICGLSLPLYSLSRVASSLFYAMKKTRSASIMIYSEVIFVLPICIIILPLIFELSGVWIALILTQFVLILLSVLLRKQDILEEEKNRPYTKLSESKL